MQLSFKTYNNLEEFKEYTKFCITLIFASHNLENEGVKINLW